MNYVEGVLRFPPPPPPLPGPPEPPVPPRGRGTAPWWCCPNTINKAPILATVLLEYANVGQLYRMWHDRTAAGQELTSWVAVCLALICYCVFFKVCTPEQKWARYMNLLGVGMNLLVCATVIYFRYCA